MVTTMPMQTKIKIMREAMNSAAAPACSLPSSSVKITDSDSIASWSRVAFPLAADRAEFISQSSMKCAEQRTKECSTRVHKVHVQRYTPTCNGHTYVEVGWLARPQISKDMVPWKRVKIEIEKPLFPSDLVSGDSGQVLGAAGRSMVRPNFTHVLEFYDGTEVLFSSAAPL